MLTALIIDDEAPSRDELRALLGAHADIEVLGECANALEGIAQIHRLRPDVVFLDIQMPRVSGLEMVGMIEPAALPRIVFVTAYDEHALKAFEEHAADYLLKPIDPQRLAKSLQWLRAGARPASSSAVSPLPVLRHVPCASLSRISLLGLDDIEYVYTDLSGVHVVCDKRQGITELTLKTLQERTPLLRCHRQYLVNIDQIAEIEMQDNGSAEIVTRSARRVPVSRRYLRELKDRLLLS
jgi:two-component system LytT family response regulator